jgi:RimJ/RimL family protein N-acetyltransferase
MNFSASMTAEQLSQFTTSVVGWPSSEAWPATRGSGCSRFVAAPTTNRWAIAVSSSVDAPSMNPEIACELLKRFHGHGYATEAARAVMEAAFATGRERIWSTVGAWNAPSLRVLDKLGFQRHYETVDDRGRPLIYLLRQDV